MVLVVSVINTSPSESQMEPNRRPDGEHVSKLHQNGLLP